MWVLAYEQTNQWNKIQSPEIEAYKNKNLVH